MSDKSKEELESEKLMCEIKNLKRSPFNSPTFYLPLFTFIISCFVYSYLLMTGFFSSKMAHLDYIIDTLGIQAKALKNDIKRNEAISVELNSENEQLRSDINDLKAQKKSDSLALNLSRQKLTDEQRMNSNLILDNKKLIEKRDALLSKILDSEKYLVLIQKQFGQSKADNSIKFMTLKISVNNFLARYKTFEKDLKNSNILPGTQNKLQENIDDLRKSYDTAVLNY